MRLYTLAAEQGHASAQNCLGVCYMNMNMNMKTRKSTPGGVDKADMEEGEKEASVAAAAVASAVKWYRLASDQGYAPAQTNLGYCYAHGLAIGVEERHDDDDDEKKEACRLYTLAASQGYAQAQFNLGVYYQHGKGVGADVGVDDAKDDAKDGKDDDDVDGKDEVEAIHWFRSAAAQNNTNALIHLGYLYQTGGHGVDQDIDEAIRLYRLAASYNDAGGQFNLAVCYENGIGVLKDQAEAERVYRLLAKRGYRLAKKALLRLEIVM